MEQIFQILRRCMLDYLLVQKCCNSRDAQLKNKRAFNADRQLVNGLASKRCHVVFYT